MLPLYIHLFFICHNDARINNISIEVYPFKNAKDLYHTYTKT